MEEKNLKSLINTGFVFGILAIISGLFYREFTKYFEYTAGTKLALVHTHLMALGMFMYLILTAFAINSNILSIKKFRIFRIIYNIGLVLMVGTIFAKGVLEVKGTELTRGISASIAGISGISHILLSISLIILFLVFKEMKIIKSK